jgi:CheY-like chemotaxis protein
VNDGHWILIVDDDEDIRDVIALVLGSEGYRAIGAADGQEALERIRANGPPALVLLDLMMPRMSGPDFAYALRHDAALASIPIVILSGDATASAIAESLGARGCLLKPVELDKLVGTVAELAPAAPRGSSP